MTYTGKRSPGNYRRARAVSAVAIAQPSNEIYELIGQACENAQENMRFLRDVSGVDYVTRSVAVVAGTIGDYVTGIAWDYASKIGAVFSHGSHKSSKTGPKKTRSQRRQEKKGNGQANSGGQKPKKGSGKNRRNKKQRQREKKKSTKAERMNNPSGRSNYAAKHKGQKPGPRYTTPPVYDEIDDGSGISSVRTSETSISFRRSSSIGMSSRSSMSSMSSRRTETFSSIDVESDMWGSTFVRRNGMRIPVRRNLHGEYVRR